MEATLNNLSQHWAKWDNHIHTSCSPKTSMAAEASLRSFSVNGSGSPVIPTENIEKVIHECNLLGGKGTDA